MGKGRVPARLCTLPARIPLKWVENLLILEIVSVELGLFYGVAFLFTRTKSQVQILYRPLCLSLDDATTCVYLRAVRGAV